MVKSMDWAIFHAVNAGVATREWLEDPVTALADALVPLYALATVVELETAGDPAAHLVATHDPPRRIVQAAAVPVDEPSRRVGHELSERGDAVLPGHLGDLNAGCRSRVSPPPSA